MEGALWGIEIYSVSAWIVVKIVVKTLGEGCSNLPSLLDLNELGFKVRILSPRLLNRSIHADFRRVIQFRLEFYPVCFSQFLTNDF